MNVVCDTMKAVRLYGAVHHLARGEGQHFLPLGKKELRNHPDGACRTDGEAIGAASDSSERANNFFSLPLSYRL